MPKYLVPVTRNCTETTNVDVEAANAEEAMEKALDEVRENEGNFNWVYDDGSGGGDEPYIADDNPDNIEEIKP